MQLTLNELVFVGSLIENQTDMSFFKNLKVGLKGDEQKTLEEKGLYRDGALSGPLLEASLVMGKAHKTARVVMQIPSGVIEKGVFTLGSLQVLVETIGSDIEVSFLEDFKGIRYDISDHTGLSLQQHAKISVMLDVKPLLFTLSLVDWVRRASLLSYAGVESAPDLSLTHYMGYLENPMQNSVTRLMCKFYGLEMPNPADFEDFKANLIERGIMTITGDMINLNTELMRLAMNFSIPDTQLVLETYDGRLADKVIAANNVILCAGIKDILAFNATDEGIEMMSISSAELVSRVEAYLKCPDLS